MFDTVIATRFHRRMTRGRTGPFLLECERGNGNALEVVAKFNGPQLPLSGLIREALCAMLAADLGLPVPDCCCVDLTPEYAKIQAPTLVIGAMHDTQRPPEKAQQVASEIRGARYVLADTGHFMNLETPQLFADTVLGFFKGK